jgi:membrane protein DedA with SNARE-associated domain
LRLGKTAAIGLLLALLHVHFHHHGSPIDYAGIAAAAAASWIGVPGPGEPVLIAAGVLAAHHKLDIFSVVFVAWLAAAAGGAIGWAIGMWGGRPVLTAPGPLLALRLRAVERGEEVFGRYPVIAILLTPTWIAGINRVRPAVFLIVNSAAALAWAVGIGVAAYLIGPTVIDAVSDLGVITGVGIVLLVAAGIVFEIRRRRGRSERPHQLGPGPGGSEQGEPR